VDFSEEKTMSLVDMTKYNGVPLTSICSGGPFPSNLYQSPSGEYILVSKQAYETGHKEALALTAFMGWLTSRDEVTEPLSACHDAGQAARLVGQFCDAQGWKIDDAQFEKDIRDLKHKYPD